MENLKRDARSSSAEERLRLHFITELMEGKFRKEIDEANDSFWRTIDIIKGIHERLESERSADDDEKS